MKKINVFGSCTNQDELNNLKKVLDTEWLGAGQFTSQFENSLKNRLSLNNFLMVNSGSNALYMACVLLNLPKNSEIIMPSYTWLSCAHAVILAGHTPIFCDVDYDSMNVTATTISEHISKKTRAIMVVHYAGKPVDMQPILDLGFPVIEDAAHAVDSYIQNKACGSIGDIGIYSFDAIKNIAAGEAGGITAKNETVFKRAENLRYCGISSSAHQQSEKNEKWWEYNIQEIFPKMMPNDLTSAVALAQLDKLDFLQNARKKIWGQYQLAFKNIDWLKTPEECNENEQHSYFTYCIRVPQRDNLARFLLKSGIYTNLRYHPLHLNSIYKQQFKSLPNTEKLNLTGLNIPLHPGLSSQEVDYVIEKILALDKWTKNDI
jgi:dTDP-4-amino-4,6-dideoxygalactose transaminase